MDRATYLDTIAEESAAFYATAERMPLDAPVPGCPGWSVEDLLFHLAEVHRFWAEVAARRLQLPDEVEEPERPSAAAIVSWGRGEAARLHEVLATTPSATPVWTWAAQKDVAFIVRRMAQETAVHRWDAELAGGAPRPSRPNWRPTAWTSS